MRPFEYITFFRPNGKYERVRETFIHYRPQSDGINELEPCAVCVYGVWAVVAAQNE